MKRLKSEFFRNDSMNRFDPVDFDDIEEKVYEMG